MLLCIFTTLLLNTPLYPCFLHSYTQQKTKDGRKVLSVLPNKFQIIFAIGREEADCDHSTVGLPCVAPFALAGWRYFSAL